MSELAHPHPDPDAGPLARRLAAMIGQPMGRSGPSIAPDPVNLPMIRHWVAAFDDFDPVYLDPDEAARSRFGQIIAPPLMLQTWTFPTPKITGIAERGGSPVEASGESALTVLDAAGFTGTLASNSEFELLRPLHLGEVVNSRNHLESVSDEKRTRLGVGYFVTWVTTYRVGDDEVVGRQRFRVLKFRPPRAESSSSEATPEAAPPPAAAAQTPTVSAAAEAAPPNGERLPSLTVEMTATRIVAGAIATRDFMPVHHDPAYARQQGAPDIFMNILSTTGHCSRYLTDWGGPDAFVTRLALRLGVPVFPGSTLTFDGMVTGETLTSSERQLSVAFQATNHLGPHATVTATVTLPR